MCSSIFHSRKGCNVPHDLIKERRPRILLLLQKNSNGVSKFTTLKYPIKICERCSRYWLLQYYYIHRIIRSRGSKSNDLCVNSHDRLDKISKEIFGQSFARNGFYWYIVCVHYARTYPKYDSLPCYCIYKFFSSYMSVNNRNKLWTQQSESFLLFLNDN